MELHNKKCDEISTKLDQTEINTQDEFTPKYDINDTFEDLVVAK